MRSAVICGQPYERVCHVAKLAVVGLAGCGIVTGVEYRRELGVIDTGSSRARVVVAPDTVAVGIPFRVEITTFGSGSCTRADGAEVQLRGGVADIEAYDRVQISGACTSDLSPFVRSVSVKFDVAGAAVLRVRGRSLFRTADRRDSVVVIERVVQVR